MLIIILNKCREFLRTETAVTIVSNLTNNRWNSARWTTFVSSCLGVPVSGIVMASGGSLLSSTSVGSLCVLPHLISCLFKFTESMCCCFSAFCLCLVALLAFKFGCKPLEVAVLVAIAFVYLLDIVIAIAKGKNLDCEKERCISRSESCRLMLAVLFSLLTVMRLPSINKSNFIEMFQRYFNWYRNNCVNLSGNYVSTVRTG